MRNHTRIFINNNMFLKRLYLLQTNQSENNNIMFSYRSGNGLHYCTTSSLIKIESQSLH